MKNPSVAPSARARPNASRCRQSRPNVMVVLRRKNEALTGHDRAGPYFFSLGRHPVHERVVMRRIVMEDHQAFGAGSLAKPGTFLPGGMAPTGEARIFLFGIGRIIDHEISAFDQAEDVPIRFARHVL